MTISTRLVVAFWAPLLAAAQPPVAPPPRLALDELVKEYKRLGLPLPPPGAELVRLKWDAETPPCLGFRLPPAKPGDDPQYLIGVTTYRYPPGKPVKTVADALGDVEPGSVVALLCTAAQCRVLGQNEVAEALYARGLAAVAKPVPPVWRHNINQFGLGEYRANGWRLHVEGENRSAHLELRHEAFGYWHGKIMEPGSDRRDVLRYLKAANLGFHTDVRDLERTVAPRKSKPGTAEALIDDLTEWRTWDDINMGEDSSGDLHPGEAAYWKLAEMGFDAIPTLLDHMEDTRFTRHPGGQHDYTGFEWRLFTPTHVDQLAARLVHHFADDSAGEDGARAWWEKARKVGEEKWLVEHALTELQLSDLLWTGKPNRVILRALGAKYPRRLAEVYRNLLRKENRSDGAALELESRVVTLEVIASKLPRDEKLALLVEAAGHYKLAHRNAALAVLARFDVPAFRKHLLAALKKDLAKVEGGWLSHPQAELAFLVWQTADPSCWEALSALTQKVPAEVRIQILRQFQRDWTEPDDRPLFRLAQRPEPNSEKARRRELLRFLLGFLSDDSAIKGDEDQPSKRVQDIAALVLAGQLGFNLNPYTERGPVSCLFVRAVVAKAAAEELTRLKK